MSDLDETRQKTGSSPSTSHLANPAVWRIGAAEAVGSFILVFLGCGAAVVSGADIVSTGLAFGIAIVIGAAAFGRISGAHFNPAVTVGVVIAGRLSWRQTPIYFIGQLVGAIVAAMALFLVFQGIPSYDAPGAMGQNAFGSQTAIEFAWWAAFLVEVVLTALFLWVILGVTDDRNNASGVAALAPVAIGLALAAIHFVAIPLTGTSVNPTRSIGPALFAGWDAIGQLWLFILAPLLGAAIAGLSYVALFGRDAAPVSGSGLGDLTGDSTAPSPASTDAAVVRETTTESAAVRSGVTETTTPGGPWPARIVQDGWEWDYDAQAWKPLEGGPDQTS